MRVKAIVRPAATKFVEAVGPVSVGVVRDHPLRYSKGKVNPGEVSREQLGIVPVAELVADSDLLPVAAGVAVLGGHNDTVPAVRIDVIAPFQEVPFDIAPFWTLVAHLADKASGRVAVPVYRLVFGVSV